MCQHDDFEIIYYNDGIMLRLCRYCGQVEMHVEREWNGLRSVQDMLDWVNARGYVK